MSTRRILAIFLKEAQDIRTNKNIILMYLLPFVIVLIYKNFIPNMPVGFVLSFGLIFLAALVGMYVPAMLIAEEKEKCTLDVLMLSPATPLDIFLGKGLLTFVSIIICTVILIFVAGGSLSGAAPIIAGMALTSGFCINFGMIIGLLAQNQMATGVIGTPLYMIFLLVPLLAQLSDSFITKLALLLPTHHYFEILRLVLEDGKGLGETTKQLAIILASIVVSFILLLAVYQRRGLTQDR